MTGRAIVGLLALPLALSACEHRVAPASMPLPPSASPAPSVSPAPGAPAAPASAALPAAPRAPEVAQILARFFARFVDGTDFAFLSEACPPKVERFLTMRDADIAQVVRSARAFFRGKRGISYVPDLAALEVEARPDGTVARLPVTLSWTYPAPTEWGDEWPIDPGADAPRIARRVTVDVEIALDASGRIARYVETRVRTPKLLVTSDFMCPDGLYETPEPFREQLAGWLVEDFAGTMKAYEKEPHPKRGTIVHDLGETFVVAENPKGSSVARRVRGPEGEGWMVDNVAYAVPAGTPERCAGAGSPSDVMVCLNQTAAAGSDCLRPAGDGGR